MQHLHRAFVTSVVGTAIAGAAAAHPGPGTLPPVLVSVELDGLMVEDRSVVDTRAPTNMRLTVTIIDPGHTIAYPPTLMIEDHHYNTPVISSWDTELGHWQWFNAASKPVPEPRDRPSAGNLRREWKYTGTQQLSPGLVKYAHVGCSPREVFVLAVLTRNPEYSTSDALALSATGTLVGGPVGFLLGVIANFGAGSDHWIGYRWVDAGGPFEVQLQGQVGRVTGRAEFLNLLKSPVPPSLYRSSALYGWDPPPFEGRPFSELSAAENCHERPLSDDIRGAARDWLMVGSATGDNAVIDSATEVLRIVDSSPAAALDLLLDLYE